MPDNRTQPIRVLGIPGSLREGSFNKGLLRAAREEAPEHMQIDLFELDAIPLFDQDVEDEGDPAPVRRMKTAIREADAVLIAVPEYQHGMSGVLKNALDWASRPPRDAPLTGKVAGMMGASPSPVGTARAHLQLRRVLSYNQCRMVTKPEVLVAHAPDKFDDEGRFTDEKGREFIRKHLAALAEEVRKKRSVDGES